MKDSFVIKALTVLMRAEMRLALLSLCLLTTIFWSLGNGTAMAQVLVLDFEGLQNLERVANFYNGGTGGNGSGPGPNFGVQFNPDALASIDADAGGTGNFGGEPSPSTTLFFLTGSAAIMNVPAGFQTGFSFFYSAINSPGTVTVYDSLNGTGNVLATLVLPVTPSDGGDPTGAFSPFFPIGVSFVGTARSVAFGGVQNQIGFDNVTFGSATPGEGSECDTACASPQALHVNTFNRPLIGGGRSETLCGDERDNIIEGRSGNDILCGFGGKDVLRGQNGDDDLFGGSGDDTMIGGPGNDMLFGEAGNDQMVGGTADETINDPEGRDTLMGGPGNDSLFGSEARDTLQGDEGDDLLDGGGAGGDRCDGGSHITRDRATRTCEIITNVP